MYTPKTSLLRSFYMITQCLILQIQIVIRFNCIHVCVYNTLQVVKFNYGMKDKNPIDHVHFYKKDDPNKAIKIDKSEVGVNVISTTYSLLESIL